MTRRIASGCQMACLMSVFLMFLIVGVQGYDERRLTYRVRSAMRFGNVYVASFGNPLIRASNFELLRPPKGHDLCKPIPINDSMNYGLNANNTDQFVNYRHHIGLLIPRGVGDCSEEVQTKVALEMQKKIPALRYLLIHGDHKAGSTIVTLNIAGGDKDGAYDGMGVMYVPYPEYIEINDLMIEETDQQSVSPHFLDPTNRDWKFGVSVSGKIVVRTDTDRQTEIELFYWLRLTLFVILIVTPCFRACFLWYSSGGRLHWRRDDNGRITGILYVPPMPIWLWMQRNPQQAGEPISQKLSEEQFGTLPVIKYQRNKKYQEDPSESGVGEVANEPDIELGENTTGEEPHPPKGEEQSMDIEMQRTEDTEDMNLLPSLDSLSDGSDNESPPASPLAQVSPESAPELSTTCTMCSICIDDFETGEELVLLPRCKHAFHKECIHPWLLERQGCCPLCKVKVLDDGSGDSTEEGGSSVPDESEPTPVRQEDAQDDRSRREDTVPDEEEATATGTYGLSTESANDRRDGATTESIP